VLVNCAGINSDSVLLRATDASIDQVLATNLVGPIKVTRAVLKAAMRQKDALSIINVGSVVGTIGNRGQCVYAASKSGLVGFTKSLAKEYGGRRVRANVLEPGFIDVGMTEDLSDEVSGSFVCLHADKYRGGASGERSTEETKCNLAIHKLYQSPVTPSTGTRNRERRECARTVTNRSTPVCLVAN
jgi:NAD(P)-dependent dehydrogenase (short-subunit alcohol dehydrogenase family)